MNHRPFVYQACLNAAIGFIRGSVQGTGRYYKVGITGHIVQRWYRKDGGYEWDRHGFRRLMILYTAPWSNNAIPESSGRLDIKCIGRDQVYIHIHVCVGSFPHTRTSCATVLSHIPTRPPAPHPPPRTHTQHHTHILKRYATYTYVASCMIQLWPPCALVVSMRAL